MKSKVSGIIKVLFATKKSIFITIASSLALVGGVTGVLVLTNEFNSSKNKICTITFDSVGGTIPEKQEIRCGDKASKPTNPEKVGFTFKYWKYNNNEYDFSMDVSSDIILKAYYEQNPDTEIVKISFNTDGGSKIEDIEIAKGTKLNQPLIPTKNGYVFKYWSYNNQRFDFTKDINESITLVANWEKEELNISKENKKNNNNSNKGNTNSLIQSSNVEKCTYEKKNIATEYGGVAPMFDVGLDESRQMDSYYGFWSYNYNGCDIKYKSSDSSIATISTTGTITGKKLGTTNVDICVVDKNSGKELDCFRWKINVDYTPGSKRAIEDSNKLVNAIDGYYWYLDGYEYAYIKVDNIDWYGHKCLDWSSKYMDIQNNKFVTTEDTGDMYYASNIHNTFLVNPTEFAYDLIEKYNMHVSSGKLYITLGGKTYSFTKRTSEKEVKAKLSVDNSNFTVGNGEYFGFDINVSPSYARYRLNVVASNTSILTNCSVQEKHVSCRARQVGTTTLTISDSGGASVTVTVRVTEVNVTGISLNKSSIDLERGKSESLVANISPSNATNNYIRWTSNNTAVATVDGSGKVTAVGKGTATITATTVDGNYSASCNVNVSNPRLTASASIGVSTRITNNSATRGVVVSVTANGGTGSYRYTINLYKDGELIGSSSYSTSSELFVVGYSNGSYTAEFEVIDSEYSTTSGTTNSTISGF